MRGYSEADLPDGVVITGSMALHPLIKEGGRLRSELSELSGQTRGIGVALAALRSAMRGLRAGLRRLRAETLGLPARLGTHCSTLRKGRCPRQPMAATKVSGGACALKF